MIINISLLYIWICIQNIYHIIFKPFNNIAMIFHSQPSLNEMFTCIVSSLARPVFKEIARTAKILPVMAHKFNVFSRLHNIGQLNGFVFVFSNHFIHLIITFWFPPHLKKIILCLHEAIYIHNRSIIQFQFVTRYFDHEYKIDYTYNFF